MNASSTATGSAPGASASPSASPSDSNGATACPAERAQPDPKRPVVTLTFDLSDDHASVMGTEELDFTPDLDVTELVFRLTANTVPTFAKGNSVTVTAAKVDHGGGTPRYETAGAAPTSQGGLLRIPFDQPVTAGTTVHAELAFRLSLGTDSFDRFGRSQDYAWFASAHPLLAWQAGYGWHDEPMIQFTAESATSEAADTDLTVTAPARDTVLMSGNPLTSTSIAGGRRSWHAKSASARDVSVAAGPFKLSDRTVDGVAVRVGAPSDGEAAQVMTDEQFSIQELVKRFGPFPFPSLSVALLPVPGGGIEYPGSILLLGSSRLVTVHETAHQYFYAMVGDSQAQHAWLDEAFASYAEQLIDGTLPPARELTIPGPVDKPTASYGHDEADYYEITYDKGAAALHAARSAVGSSKFDTAVLCYVKRMAWRIAVPKDFAAALADLPDAVAVLRRAGALS